MANTTTVVDVTDATFANDVVEASKQIPVVVDFWAPWCGPCRVLGPIIEKLAGEYAGKVKVAKINTDDNPRTATAFGIQGIPAVKAFIGGKVAGEFVGAQPEQNVRQFFSQLAAAAPRAAGAAPAAPSEDEIALRRAFALLSAGRVDQAETALRDLVTRFKKKPDLLPEALVGLASILADRGEREEAEKLLDRAPKSRKARSFKHMLFLRDFAERHKDENLQAEAAANPNDPRARYRWGLMLTAQGQFEAALDELLASVRLDRTFADEAARKAALAVFDIVGPDAPVTRAYQRKLSQMLF